MNGKNIVSALLILALITGVGSLSLYLYKYNKDMVKITQNNAMSVVDEKDSRNNIHRKDEEQDNSITATESNEIQSATPVKENPAKENMQSLVVPADWKTFTAPETGFTLRYPSDWQLINDNDPQDCPKNENCANDIHDVYEIESPDGIVIRYVTHEMWPGYVAQPYVDKESCGMENFDDCLTTIAVVDKFTVSNYGDVYLIKGASDTQGRGIYKLYKPMSKEIEPVVGSRSNINFDALPMLSGEKTFDVLVTYNYPKIKKNGIANMSDEEFFALDSVKKADMILKSIMF